MTCPLPIREPARADLVAGHDALRAWALRLLQARRARFPASQRTPIDDFAIRTAMEMIEDVLSTRPEDIDALAPEPAHVG